jgi:4-hydroxy-3-polyprenylbenzoate decarboxylase
MDVTDRKLVIGITGASGSLYAKVLLDRLAQMPLNPERVGLVYSRNAAAVWRTELGQDDLANYPFPVYAADDFMAPFASGSARYDTMIICPCSMGTLGRIAAGISNDLMTRAADVMLKERRRLILVPRDTPLSLIHLRNMTSVAEAGAILCPAMPSFYSKPADLYALAATVVDRVLDLAGLPVRSFRWGEGDAV